MYAIPRPCRRRIPSTTELLPDPELPRRTISCGVTRRTVLLALFSLAWAMCSERPFVALRVCDAAAVVAPLGHLRLPHGLRAGRGRLREDGVDLVGCVEGEVQPVAHRVLFARRAVVPVLVRE